MRASRLPVPPGHVECQRCAELVADAGSVAFCPHCAGRLLDLERLVEVARERQVRRLAASGGERWLTAEEAAAILGYSSHHVRRLIRRRVLPERRIGARVWTSEPAVLALVRDTPARPNPAA